MSLFSWTVVGALVFAGGDFQSSHVEQKKLKCEIQSQLVYFPEMNEKYKVAESGQLREVRNCQKIKIQNQNYLSLEYVSDISSGKKKVRALTYEVVLLKADGKVDRSVRTESIDQIELVSDLTSYQFEKKYQIQWGLHSQDKTPMIKIAVSYGQDSYSILLKYEPKKKIFIDQI